MTAIAQPHWWLRSSSAGGVQPNNVPAQASGTQHEQQAQANGVADQGDQDGADAAEAGSWTAPAVGGDRRPAARYEHAVALVDSCMYLVGGNSGVHIVCMLSQRYATPLIANVVAGLQQCF